ncbi:hypothetical protein JZ751_002304, partial [Albula glossodonta]
ALGLLLLLTVVLITTALVLKPSRTGLITRRRPKPKWRSLGEPSIPPGYVYAGASVDIHDGLGHRGVGEGAEAEEPAVCKGYKSGRVDLEDFNVKTLYDKLEDQTLHLASQLAKHRKDTMEFYRNICQKTDCLKVLLENMDQAKLNQLREIFSLNVAHLASHAAQNAEKDVVKDPSVPLLQAVLRAAEGLMYRIENCVQQDAAAGPCQGEVGDSGVQTGYMQGSHESVGFSSPDMAEPKDLQVTVPPPADAVTQQGPAGYFSDQELSKLVALTPLSRTLQEIQQSLQTVTDGLEVEPVGDLVPVALGNLSPHHFAVFLFGCRLVRLLCNTHGFPPLTLLLARAVPASHLTSLAQHCHRDFFYDTTNQILYLHQDKLEHVGEFIATLLHSMAFVASAVGLALFHSSFTNKLNKVHSLEQEIDCLNEVFLQLSMGLQERAAKRSGMENRDPAQGAAESCLSRHGTILLELKRRSVVQRLSEMQALLSQISMQHPDRTEQDGQEIHSQAPESKEPENQEPDSWVLESHVQESQGADTQRSDRQEADSQKTDSHEPEAQTPDILTSGSQESDKKISDIQLRSPISMNQTDRDQGSQTSERLIAEQNGLPAVI